jgi:hypothetical protein
MQLKSVPLNLSLKTLWTRESDMWSLKNTSNNTQDGKFRLPACIVTCCIPLFRQLQIIREKCSLVSGTNYQGHQDGMDSPKQELLYWCLWSKILQLGSCTLKVNICPSHTLRDLSPRANYTDLDILDSNSACTENESNVYAYVHTSIGYTYVFDSE